MSNCIHCNDASREIAKIQIDEIKEKAKEWANKSKYAGTIVIVKNPSGKTYGFRTPDCECLRGADALEEVDRIYVD